MINMSIWEMLILMGIPSAVTGCAFGALKKWLNSREQRIEDREKARAEMEYMLVEAVNASLSLGEATANAVSRIPDTHCNGDMHEALDYARDVKHRQKAMLTRLGIQALNEEGV